MRWGEKRYHFLDYELKQMFKEKVYKNRLKRRNDLSKS